MSLVSPTVVLDFRQIDEVMAGEGKIKGTFVWSLAVFGPFLSWYGSQGR